MNDRYFQAAGEIIQEIAQNHSYCVSFAEFISICEMNGNDYYNAIGELKRLISKTPRSIRFFYQLSRAYADIGNLQLSIFLAELMDRSHQYYDYYEYLSKHNKPEAKLEPNLLVILVFRSNIR